MCTVKTRFKRGVRKAAGVLAAGAGVLLFAVVLEGSVDVIGRYFFNKPIVGTLERAQVFIASMVFLAWGYTQIEERHVKLEMFLHRLPGRARMICRLVTAFLTMVFWALVTWQGTVTAIQYQEIGRRVFVINWSLAPVQLVVSLGAIMSFLVSIVQLTEEFRKFLKTPSI